MKTHFIKGREVRFKKEFYRLIMIVGCVEIGLDFFFLYQPLFQITVFAAFLATTITIWNIIHPKSVSKAITRSIRKDTKKSRPLRNQEEEVHGKSILAHANKTTLRTSPLSRFICRKQVSTHEGRPLLKNRKRIREITLDLLN